jgi:hypothetical protein
VPLGEAGRAHPSVSAITILQDGAPANASCSPSGGGVYRCTVSGLVNGEPHAFTASAVNAVGTSAATSAHTTWAYAAPVVSNASAAPVYRPGVTERGRGVAALSVAASDDARAFRIEETGQVIERTGATTTADITLSPGAQTLTLVPISQFQPPTGDGGNEGGAFRTTVTVAGTVYFDPAGTQASAASNTSVTVSGVRAQANGSAQGLDVVYLAWRSGNASCTADGDGRLVVSGAEVQSSSETLTKLAEYSTYNVKACASNGYGVAESATTQVFTFVFVDGPKGNTSYTVATQPTFQNDRYSYVLESAPNISVRDGFAPQYNMYGSWRPNFELSTDASPLPVSARSCHAVLTMYCSDNVEITARTAPTTVAVQFQRCVPANRNDLFTVTAAARGSYTPTFTPKIVDGVSVVDVKITWTGAFAALKAIDHRAPLCTQPPPPKPPEPEPQPTGTPPPTDPLVPVDPEG